MFIEDAEFGNLPVSIIVRLRKLFKTLKWQIHGEDDDDDSKQLFDKYCELLARLNKDERELVLNLTEDFLYYPSSSSYRPLLKRALLQIDITQIQKSKQIFLLPLVAPRHVDQIKSSTSFLYEGIHQVIPNMPEFAKKTLKAFNNPDHLKKYLSREDTLILFCDDFVGTGDTAKEVIDHYNKELRLSSDMPVLVTLVAQKLGLDVVKSLSVDVAVARIRTRGISDSDKLNVSHALNLMTQIEDKLKIEPKYRHGYKRSEALVSMMRTPDNTFPVFWCPKCLDDSAWPAPFERR